ncbi:DMT family transporter [Motilibacter aurantiacus]|uniref:DMT family transporter n=1 Tax=Motilibacter aurantiacus TaxID=2714955 RepID=UPI00140D12EC|nr:DMT family transporter [Motilibacter aurantiacus]NHC43971.1 DMT family transporter [Motilibacter aurantiacus]
MKATTAGAAFVAVGAVLWGTDALFRGDMSESVSPAAIVFWEHVVLAIVTAVALPPALRALRRAGWRAGLAVVLGIGVGASAVATALFTKAFSYGDYTTPVLLQKVQPIVVVAGAWLLLRERPRATYLPFLLLGLVGAWLIAFRDPSDVSLGEAEPALLAIGAAALWAAGTVLGRYVAPAFAPRELTALRFWFGLLGAAGVVAVTGSSLQVDGEWHGRLVLLALVPGLLAMLLYYRGLRRTPAMVATLCELAFPLTAAVVPPVFLDQRALSVTQGVGVALTAAVVVGLALAQRTGGREQGVVDSDERALAAT